MLDCLLERSLAGQLNKQTIYISHINTRFIQVYIFYNKQSNTRHKNDFNCRACNEIQLPAKKWRMTTKRDGQLKIQRKIPHKWKYIYVRLSNGKIH